MLEAFKKLLHTHRNFKNLGAIELKSAADIRNIPLTTREDLATFRCQDCPERPRWIRNTSGSTGSESLFFFSKDAAASWGARVTRSYRRLGVADMTLLNAIEDVAQGWFLLDVGGPNFYHAIGSGWSQELAIAKVKAVRPEAMMVPPPVALQIMEAIADRSFLRILVTGGTVIPESFKRRLREVTGAEVKILYASTEFGILACQAEDGAAPLQIMEDGVYVEVLGDNGETADVGTGTLVVTDLGNHSSPIIRYVTDDRVSITRDGERRYMEVYGRGGEFVNLAGSVTDKAHLLFLITKALGTDEFMLEIHCASDTLDDFLRLKVGKNAPDTDDLQKQINEVYEVRIEIRELDGPIDRFGRGKAANFRDCRSKDD